MRFHFQKASTEERGYILLVLLLIVALLSLGVLTQVQKIEFQIKRDREEEMIHRGVQYSRAVRLFFSRFKRYPASISELENTNNIRFLRKRYKDPITGKDFKPLYYDEVAAFQRPIPKQAPPAVQTQDPDANSPQNVAEEAARQAAAYDGPTTDSVVNSSPPSPDSNSGDAPAAAPNLNPDDDETNGAPPLEGVPIVGVVSVSKAKTIREFAKKNHYNEWLFIYDPNGDTKGLINTPDQPSLLQRAQQAQASQNENSAQSAGTNLVQSGGIPVSNAQANQQ